MPDLTSSQEQPSTTTIAAPFELVDRTEHVYGALAEGPKLVRVTIRKRYAGPLSRTGTNEALLAQAETGSGYVASERLDVVLGGRSGTFVVQHTGVADGDELTALGVIVPGSGTGGFRGVTGEAYEAETGVLTLKLRS